MIDAVQSPSSTGLTWCNDTPHKMMAAVATDDGKTVISRGWYRIEPGKCLHPDVAGQPRQIFSFAEAVDADNRTIRIKDKPLNWGGATRLCTRESKFEINEQGDCGGRGLAATGFAAVDMSVAAAKHCASRCRDEISPRLHPRRHLGVRSRQHTLSASRQSVAAGRCADRRVRRRLAQGIRGGSAADPEGLLPPLRHHHARHDDRARRARRRLSRLCAPDRSFAAAAESGDGRGDRQAARPQADPDQRLDRPCRQGAAAARHRRAFRGGVRHHRRRARAEAGAADLSEIPHDFTASIPRRRRCSRIWRATSWCRISSA